MGPTRSKARRGILVAFAVIGAASLAFVATGAALTRRYVVLLPDRLDDTFSATLTVGGVAAVITVAALLWYRPKLRRGLVVTVPVLGIMSLVMGFVLAIPVVTEFYNLYDFRKRPLRELDGLLRVSRFHIMNGRGAKYLLDLSDFSPSLDLYWDDYRRGSGGRDEVLTPNGGSHVHLPRRGRALRRIQPEHVLVVRCPAAGGIVGAS